MDWYNLTQEDRPLILIVDDSPLSLKVVAEILGGESYRIALADSGSAALDFIAKTRPDLILLDIVMPDVDGFEVCRRLKESPGSASIPVIFLTGHADSLSITRCYNMGGVDCITKPFNPAEIQAKVKNHLELALLKNGNGSSR